MMGRGGERRGDEGDERRNQWGKEERMGGANVPAACASALPPANWNFGVSAVTFSPGFAPLPQNSASLASISLTALVEVVCTNTAWHKHPNTHT